MKKKPIFTALILASAMAFTSCSSDDVAQVANSESQVGTLTFTAELPSVAVTSRSDEATATYGDGTKATTLYYAVYDTDKTLIVTNDQSADQSKRKKAVSFSGKKATVTFTLALGKTYKFVFWAQHDGAPYTFNSSDGSVTADYDKVNCNDDNLDAFFKYEEVVFNQESLSKNVTLTRPFAQLNIGATDKDDAEAAGLDVEQSTVKVEGVANKLDLFTGDVSGTSDVTFKLNDTPAKQANAGDFPSIDGVGAVEYLSMNYVLVGESQQNFNVTLDWLNDEDKQLGDKDVKHFYNVPLERNRRTNIYGGLLTTEGTWNIEIAPGFISEDIDKKAEDLQTKSE